MDYLKSGSFAALCKTTKDTLIHYDHLGLLHPAKVADSGYRLYLPSQIYRFASIRALVDAGLSLEEVRELLSSEDRALLEDALETSRGAIEKRVAELQRSLVRIDEILRQTRVTSEASQRAPFIVQRPRRRLALLGVSAIGSQSYEDLNAVSRTVEVACALAKTGPLGELTPYGGISTVVPKSNGPVTYDDLFFLIPDGVEYDGATLTLEAGPYAVAYYEGPADRTSSAHLQLLDYLRAIGKPSELPRYEIACMRSLDNAEGTYHCTVGMRV